MAGHDPLFTVRFRGHPNIRATNRMTLEVTKEEFLTLRGDCIVGICADTACSDLSREAREHLIRDGTRVRFVLSVEGTAFEFTAFGSVGLTLTHQVSMVVRKSEYVCSRTLAIRSSSAACDLPREMVRRLAAGSSGELRGYPELP